MFSPKLLLLGLLAAAAVMVAVDPGLPARTAVWMEGRAYRTLVKKGPVGEGELEGLRKAASVDFNARSQTRVGPGGELTDSRADLTVSDLLHSMEATLSEVPSFVPGLPFIASLSRTMLENDPQAIRFGPLPQGILGRFSAADPQRPQITLSPRLQELYLSGVPVALIVPILVHELDHLLAYILRESRRLPDNEVEYRAFRAEGFYLHALRKRFGSSDPVDATHYNPEDIEAREYAEHLRNLRRKLYRGELGDLIRQLYGPNPARR